MITFKDRSFCASPDCINECGRMFTEQLKTELERANSPEQWEGMLAVSWGYFCGEPKQKDASRT